MIAAIRRVEINEDVRIPSAEHCQRGNRLRRFSFDVIAVEVESLRVGTRPDEYWSVLLGAIALLRGEPLVAISIVNRHGNEDDRIEYIRVIVEQQVTKHGLQCLLSLDLSGVDVRLHIHNRPPQSLRLDRRLDEWSRRDDEWNVASLRRFADCPDLDLGAEDAQRVDELDDVRVVRRLGEVRAFGARLRSRLRQVSRVLTS